MQRVIGDFGGEPCSGRRGGALGKHRPKEQEARHRQPRQHQTGQCYAVEASRVNKSTARRHQVRMYSDEGGKANDGGRRAAQSFAFV